MRKHFAAWVTQKFKQQKFFVVTHDVGYGIWDTIQAALGPYAINVGITEPHSVDFAAGLAEQEKVFLYSLAGFVTLRGLEQIKLSLAYDQSKVCIIGSGGNFYYGPQGVTHYASEDLALIANYPRIRIFYPHTPQEFDYCAESFLADGRPSFMRLDPRPIHLSPTMQTINGQTLFFYQHCAAPSAFMVVAGTHSLKHLLKLAIQHPTWEIVTGVCWDDAYLQAIIEAYQDCGQTGQDQANSALPLMVISEVGPTDPLASRLQNILAQKSLSQVKLHHLNYHDSTANLHLGQEDFLVDQMGLGIHRLQEFIQHRLAT